MLLRGLKDFSFIKQFVVSRKKGACVVRNLVYTYWHSLVEQKVTRPVTTRT